MKRMVVVALVSMELVSFVGGSNTLPNSPYKSGPEAKTIARATLLAHSRLH